MCSCTHMRSLIMLLLLLLLRLTWVPTLTSLCKHGMRFPDKSDLVKSASFLQAGELRSSACVESCEGGNSRDGLGIAASLQLPSPAQQPTACKLEFCHLPTTGRACRWCVPLGFEGVTVTETVSFQC
jgi:hypothetical protein